MAGDSSSSEVDFGDASSELTDVPLPTLQGPDAEEICHTPRSCGAVANLAACSAAAGHADEEKEKHVTSASSSDQEAVQASYTFSVRETDVEDTTSATDCDDVNRAPHPERRHRTRVWKRRRTRTAPSSAVAGQSPASATHFVAATEAQGPDILLEKHNAKYDSKNSLNLTVSMFVVFPDSTAADVNNLLFNSPAGILIVLFDPAVTADCCSVVWAVTDESDRWFYRMITTYAVVLYRKDIIRDVALVESVSITGDNSKLQTLRVVFWGTRMNPSTAVAVGVLYLARHKGYRLAPTAYSSSLLAGIKAALTRQQVRFLVGVFTCTPEQVADIARSCGASGTRPFCQMFHSYQMPTAEYQECTAELAQRFGVDQQHGGNYMTHPSYAIVLGPSAKLEYAPTDAAPPLPTWLEEDDMIFRSLCVPLRDIPSWEDTEGLRSYGDQLIDLGRVKQKCTNMQWWVPRVHQLLFYVGTSRKGHGADQRRNQKKKTTWAQREDCWIRRKGSIQKDIGKWSRFPQGSLRRSYGAINVEDDDI